MEPINDFGTTNNGKTVAILSYFTLIGWLIAYFGYHQNNKTSLGSYQLRQTLLFYLAYLIVRYGVELVLGAVWLSTGVFSLYYLMRLVELAFFILWIIGLIGAINGEKKPIPFIGDQAQTMFSTL